MSNLTKVKQGGTFSTPEQTRTFVYDNLSRLKNATNPESGIIQYQYANRFSLFDEAENIKDLMKKYDNVPMSLADACLVRMSELIDTAVVFTIDSDFHIYRKNGKKEISLIIPE